MFEPANTGVASPRSLTLVTPVFAKRVVRIARNDEISDELRDLLHVAHVFSPSRIRREPMINPVPMRANCTKTYAPSTFPLFDFLNADRGDLFMRSFLEECTVSKLAEHFQEACRVT